MTTANVTPINPQSRVEEPVGLDLIIQEAVFVAAEKFGITRAVACLTYASELSEQERKIAA